MSSKKFHRYMMSVLSYYRSEWTEISDNDKNYRFLVTTELEHLIKGCMKRGTNIPNAAKEVDIFLDLQVVQHNADAQSNSMTFPKTLNIDFGSTSTMKDTCVEPQDSEDDADA